MAELTELRPPHAELQTQSLPVTQTNQHIQTTSSLEVLDGEYDMTQQQAQERIQYQANLIENISDAIISTDLNFAIQSWNRAAEAIYGWQLAEIVGQSITLLLKPPFSSEQLEVIAHQIFETGHWEGEILQQRKDGSDVYIFASASLIRDTYSQPVGIVSINRDITKYKQAEEEQKRLLAAEREQRLLAETLGEIFLALAAQTQPEAVLAEILRQGQRLVPYSAANIALLEGETLHIARWQGYQDFNYKDIVSHLKQPLQNYPVDRQVVETKQPLVVPDTDQNSEWIVIPETAWIRSYISVPICSQERVLGLLRLDSHIPGKFSVQDGKRLQPLAHAAAIALENARLYDQIRQDLEMRKQIEAEIIRRNAELLALQFAGATIASSLDLEDVLKAVTREMTHLLRVSGCIISEWNQATDTIVIMAMYGLDEGWPERPLAKVSTLLANFPLTKWVLVERRAQQMTLSQPYLNPAELAYMQSVNIKTLLMLPMEFQDRIVGLVELMDDRAERTFSNEEVALVQLLANQAASAIENARLYTEIRQRLKEQIALHRAGAVLSSTLDRTTILKHIVEQMGQAVDATSAYLCSYEPETMTSTVLTEYFSPQASLKECISDVGITYPLPRDFSGSFELLQAGQPEQIHFDNSDMNEYRRGHMDQFGAQTILNIPLQIGGRIIAFAELWESRRRREFTTEEITLCQGIAQQAAMALENARLYDQARQEIAERIQAEKELRQSEAKNRALLNAIPDLMFRVTRTGQYLDYHSGKDWDLTLPATEYIGKNLKDVFPPTIAKLMLDHIRQALNSGIIQIFEYDLSPSHGVQYYETRLVVSGSDEVLGIVRNITERKRAEAQAIQAERLAALGKLAASLTHEINNPLQSIQTHLDLVLDFKLASREKKKYLYVIRHEIDRLSNITRYTLNFARPRELLHQPVLVTDLLQQVLVLAGKQLQQNGIQVTTDFRPVPEVLVTPDQLTQVFLNLVINAIEAISPSGQLHIAVYPEAQQVAISFTNNGPIIPPELLPHIFEPFFTTKPDGSGLGLWVSHSLIQQYGGTLVVENLGSSQGVAFTVSLPAVTSLETEA